MFVYVQLTILYQGITTYAMPGQNNYRAVATKQQCQRTDGRRHTLLVPLTKPCNNTYLSHDRTAEKIWFFRQMRR